MTSTRERLGNRLRPPRTPSFEGGGLTLNFGSPAVTYPVDEAGRSKTACMNPQKFGLLRPTTVCEIEVAKTWKIAPISLPESLVLNLYGKSGELLSLLTGKSNNTELRIIAQLSNIE